MKLKSLVLALVLALPLSSQAQNTTTGTTMTPGSATLKIGGMPRVAFDRINAAGSRAVMAVRPTSNKLSSADERTLMMMASGGQRQLAISQVALAKITREDVRVLAQSEVEEQTTLSTKLAEIASAKGVTLPAGPDQTTQDMIIKLNGMNGADFDRYYVQTSGVEGHMELERTAAKARKASADPSIKALGQATLPVIQMHLKVSRNTLNDMGGMKGHGFGR
jgi:putative membrane protein